jgi:hypothetical protein
VTLDPDAADGMALGRRCVDKDLMVEVLITKAGLGPVAVNGVPLRRKSGGAPMVAA